MLVSFFTWSQDFTQKIQGKIIDQISQEEIPFATVILLETDPLLGTTSDLDGQFVIEKVPIGRYNLEISCIGYEPIIIPEVVVTSAKRVNLNVELKENVYMMEEVVVKPKIVKDQPINAMATVSARMLSVEEASRYAGGFDDPARLAASFPGVASSVANNAIIIRGNAPKFLQWKMEGVEIPNPNHFADLAAFGGGGLTALSSNLLANSDFYTGAFPAEYNNALSGVFDIHMRKGNSSEAEHSIEIGAIGIDLATEGPISRNSKASYLVNYRYSTLGLVAPLLPEDANGTNYQDLSFKLHWPTKKAGQFSFWGIGLLDRSGATAELDTTLHNYYQDVDGQAVEQHMGAVGLNHRFIFGHSAYLNTTVAASSSGIDLQTDRLNSVLVLQPENVIRNWNYNVTVKSFLNKKFSARHSNRTGVTLRGLGYDLTLQEAQQSTDALTTLVEESGFTTLLSAYSQSAFSMDQWSIKVGINSQLFTLKNQVTIEPRLGVQYKLNEKHELSMGYGLHSRLEPINIYFVETPNGPTRRSNQDLDFTKAHHLVFGYDWSISDKLHLKVEPYFQYLFDIPVVAGTSTSLLNLQNDWFVNDAYVNEGVGMNYGLDLTLEQFIQNGFYYLISASLFESRYQTDTEIWYNTRFNQNYLFNFLVGKEFRLGSQKQNVFGLNLRFSYQGGQRFSPVDLDASIAERDVVYNEMTPFFERAQSGLVSHVTLSYEWNKKRTSQRVALKILNATGYEEFLGHRFNLRTSQVEEFREALMIPNLSYRISF